MVKTHQLIRDTNELCEPSIIFQSCYDRNQFSKNTQEGLKREERDLEFESGVTLGGGWAEEEWGKREKWGEEKRARGCEGRGSGGGKWRGEGSGEREVGRGKWGEGSG